MSDSVRYRQLTIFRCGDCLHDLAHFVGANIMLHGVSRIVMGQPRSLRI